MVLFVWTLTENSQKIEYVNYLNLDKHNILCYTINIQKLVVFVRMMLCAAGKERNQSE